MANDSDRRAWYVDLTLGAWRPREAATQLARQAGVALPPLPPGLDEGAGGAAAIDIEWSGDPVITTAFADAATVAAALPGGATITVLTPRFGLPLRRENEWFFVFLRRFGIAVAAVGNDAKSTIGRSLFERRKGMSAPPAPHQTDIDPAALRLLRFFPGFVPAPLIVRFSIDPASVGLLTLAPGVFLIPPDHRDRDPGSASRDFDALEDMEAEDDGLLALSQTFCTSYFADAIALSRLALKKLGGGSPDIARDLAERARAVARDPEAMAAAETAWLETDLSERRFPDLVRAGEPSQRMPGELREGLERLKAWGDVMSGNLVAAERRLSLALSRLEAGGKLEDDEFRLLLALAAARLEQRDLDRAAALCQSLRGSLDGNAKSDLRLLAETHSCLQRFHHVRGERDQEQAALTDSFATSLGARPLAEIVAMNLLMARALTGDTGSATRQAVLRAALAWLAIEPAEGLAHNAVLAVVGREPATRSDLDLAVSEAIGTALEEAWPGLTPAKPKVMPLFHGAGAVDLPAERMVGGTGAAVAWTGAASEDAVFSRVRLKLIGLALAALAELCPSVQDLNGGTVLIDTDLGTDVPRTREAALSAGLRLKAKRFAYGLDTIVLEDGIRARLAEGLSARLSPAIAGLDGSGARITVRFRRHLGRATVEGEDAHLLDLFRGSARLTLPALAGHLGLGQETAEARLRALEARHLIRLEIPPR